MPVSVIVLIAMTVIVAILAVYRRLVTRDEDDTLHIADPASEVVTHQRKVASTLTQIDHLGIALTVATALYGIALVAIHLYSDFQSRGL